LAALQRPDCSAVRHFGRGGQLDSGACACQIGWAKAAWCSACDAQCGQPHSQRRLHGQRVVGTGPPLLAW
jgi:hypothetical protein